MDLSIDYKLVGWLRRGYRRKKVLIHLKGQSKPVTPTQISHALKLQLVKVSATLSELRKNKLARCLNPKAPYARLYAITKKGEKYLSFI